MMRRLFSLLAALLILLGPCLPASAADSAAGSTATILFTHDTHSHFLPTETSGGEIGGYTRLATLLRQQREQAQGAVVTLDGGDFSMGSLFQTVYTTDAAELRMLGALGYDVTTFGNHEYDYRAAGLRDMLNAALDSGDPLPAIVQANYLPPTRDSEGEWSENALAEAESVRAAFERYGVTDYTVIERDGLRFAVFGLLGADADACAPMSGMVFEPIAVAARRVVADIEAHADADYVICLSHSGTSADESKSEDQLLARAVDGIDVIISGHTHTTLEEPLVENGTIIVSAGEYTYNLGRLVISKDMDGSTVLEDYQLIPVDETVPDDPQAAALTESYKRLVDQSYLSRYGMTFDEVLCATPFDLAAIGTVQGQYEYPLGNLIADSYVYAVRAAEGESYIPVDFAVVGAGVIRDWFSAGDITVSDAFNVSSLGSGADGTAGYPLISVYVTGKNLRDAFEVDASVSPLMPTVQVFGAGMHWEYNTRRMIFNKVTDCWQVLEDGSRAEIEDDRLYRVVTGLYTGQMLGTVNSQSFGLLTVTPRDAAGSEITDFESCIIYNPDGSEVKEWYALASYLRELEVMPDRYAAPEGRKIIYASWNPVDLLKNPSWLTLAVVAAGVLLIAAIVLLVRLFVRRRRAKRR